MPEIFDTQVDHSNVQDNTPHEYENKSNVLGCLTKADELLKRAMEEHKKERKAKTVVQR